MRFERGFHAGLVLKTCIGIAVRFGAPAMLLLVMGCSNGDDSLEFARDAGEPQEADTIDVENAGDTTILDAVRQSDRSHPDGMETDEGKDVTLLDAAAQDAADGGETGDAQPLECSEYAAAYCAYYERCRWRSFATSFGSTETCIRRMVVRCADMSTAPGTSVTPASLGACIDALAQAECGRLKMPSACNEPGTLAIGAPCIYDQQCASASCRVSATSWCGTCGTKGQPGNACLSHEECEGDLACGSKYVCQELHGEGAQCDPTIVDCAVGLYCNPLNVCAKMLGSGERCRRFKGDCDTNQRLDCKESADAGVCGLVTIAPYDGTCSPYESTYCGASGFCTGDPGVCVRAADDGQACDAQHGPRCLPPSRCLGNTCQPPVANACE